MILLKNCPICSGKQLIKKLTCVDHSKSKEKFTIVSCGTCSFTFTNPRPKTNSLSEYYKSETYISHTNSKKGITNFLYQIVRKYSIRKKLSLITAICKTGSLLDIGCGTGEFLNTCKKNGYITKGVEPSKIAREQAIENFNLSVTKETNLKGFEKDSFEIITLWHVLEHMPEINTQIQNIKKVLKSNGTLIVAVPNHKSWDANYYKEYWAAWDVPIHLWHFSKTTITTLFKNNGFKLIKTKAMIFDSFYVSLLSEEFKHSKKHFIQAFLIGLISNIVGFFTKKGYSSMIYIFQKN